MQVAPQRRFPARDGDGIPKRKTLRQVVVEGPGKAGARERERACNGCASARPAQAQQRSCGDEQRDPQGCLARRLLSEKRHCEQHRQRGFQIEEQRSGDAGGPVQPEEEEHRPGHRTCEHDSREPGRVRPVQRSLFGGEQGAHDRERHCGTAIEQTRHGDRRDIDSEALEQRHACAERERGEERVCHASRLLAHAHGRGRAGHQAAPSVRRAVRRTTFGAFISSTRSSSLDRRTVSPGEGTRPS